MKRAALAGEEPSLLGVLLALWGTSAKATSYSIDITDAAPGAPGAGRVDGVDVENHRPDARPRGPDWVTSSEPTGQATEHSSSGAVSAGSPEPSATAGLTEADPPGEAGVSRCARHAREARSQLEHVIAGLATGDSGDPGSQEGRCGVTSSKHEARVKERVSSAVAHWARGAEPRLRALIVGGGDSIDGNLAPLVKLASRLASAWPPRDVVFLHRDGSMLEGIRAAVEECPDDLGIRDGLRLVRSTLEDFAATARVGERFDYIDVSASVGSGDWGRGDGGSSAAGFVASLGLLISEVRPDACLIL